MAGMQNFLRLAMISLVVLFALSAVPADAQGNTVYRMFHEKGSPCPPNSSPIRPDVGECVCNAGWRAGDDQRCHRTGFAQAAAEASAEASAEAQVGDERGDDELPAGNDPVIWCDRDDARPHDRVSCQLRGVQDVQAWSPGWSGSYMGGGGRDPGRPIGELGKPNFMYLLGDAGAYSINLRLQHEGHPSRYYRPRSWNVEVRGRSRMSWVREVGIAAATAIAATAICRKVC